MILFIISLCISAIRERETDNRQGILIFPPFPAGHSTPSNSPIPSSFFSLLTPLH